MVSKNDPAYKYVKQADAKEAPRKRRLEAARRALRDHEEKKRNRSSKEIAKYVARRWCFWLGIGFFTIWDWPDGWDWNWVSLGYPLFAIFETAINYPEWSRKRKAEKSG